jgi:Arc/MetJ-type ribon-helix-helix transcriptional regulator
MADETVSVKITKRLYDEIDRRVKSKRIQFDSVDSFVEFALSDILDVPPAEERLPKEDEETVSKRLSSFGY